MTEAPITPDLSQGPTLADMAAEEFERRRATARRKVAAGELDPHVANTHLLPWLALAARFGAELPELYQDSHVIAPTARAGEPIRFRILSGDICPPAETGEALATARDAAIDKADGGLDPVRNDRARRLQTLAIAFGVRPYAYRALQPAKEAA
ncbi:MAG: hypothetical protein ABIP41_09970 [Croceibacterium sp.]